MAPLTCGTARQVGKWCVVAIRASEELFLSVGARVGYFQGDPRKLVDDIGALQPTLFIGELLPVQGFPVLVWIAPLLAATTSRCAKCCQQGHSPGLVQPKVALWGQKVAIISCLTLRAPSHASMMMSAKDIGVPPIMSPLHGHAGVPRVFDRIYTGAMAKIEEKGGLAARLFKLGYGIKAAKLRRNIRHDKVAPCFCGA